MKKTIALFVGIAVILPTFAFAQAKVDVPKIDEIPGDGGRGCPSGNFICPLGNDPSLFPIDRRLHNLEYYVFRLSNSISGTEADTEIGGGDKPPSIAERIGAMESAVAAIKETVEALKVAIVSTLQIVNVILSKLTF